MRTKLFNPYFNLRRSSSYLAPKSVIFSIDSPSSKGLFYVDPNHFLSIEDNNKIIHHRIHEGLVKSPQDLLKIYDEYKKDPLHTKNIYQSSFPLKDLVRNLDPNLYQDLLSKLHPTAVNLLKLEEKKENIELYNYSIPDSKHNLEEKDYNNAVRSLSKALYFLPFIKSITDIDHKEGARLLNNFLPNSENDPIESLNEYLKTPKASKSFYKRINNNMQPHIIREFYNLLHDEITDENGVVDETLYKKKIANIPYSSPASDESEALKAIVTNFNGNNSFTDKAKQEMFNEIVRENTWIENAEALSSSNFKSSVNEYLTSLAQTLILPSYIDKFNEKVTTENNTTNSNNKFILGGSKTSSFSDKKIPFPDKYEHWFVEYVITEIISFLQDNLINTTPKKIYELSQEHDNRLSQINSSNKSSSLQWTKAFEDCEIDGIKFRCLTNEEELKEEAGHLSHCAGGYGPRCLMGVRHVVSGKDEETGERFTLRFSSSSNNRFSYDETVTKKNERGKREFLTEKSKNAIEALINKINSEEITLNSDFGNVDKDITISEAIGFDITNKEQQENLFQSYKSLNLLPTEAENLEDFTKEIGLDKFLENSINRDMNLLSQNLNTPPSSIAAKIVLKVEGPREQCGYLD